jgi:hypothetical protein
MLSESGTATSGPLHRLRRSSGRFLGITALAGLCLLAGSAAPALAATDSLFAAPTAAGTADCSSPANACSIATAVTNANAKPVADSVRIELASGIYLLSAPSPTALAITFAGPSLTFEAESGTPILDGVKTVRLLSIGATSNVTLDGLEIEFGTAVGNGGAIDNSGKLTVKRSTVSSNTASNGGAISNDAGATLTVQDSTFSHNTTTGVGGGAIISFGTATVERSAIVNNAAPINGGGINVQPAGTVTVASSTVAANTSGGLGGAMAALGMLTVEASTITGNAGSDGSAFATSTPANLKLAADVIASQSSGGACSPANGAFVDDGYNLDDDGTCISPTSPATGSHNGHAADGSSTFGAVLDAYLADGLAHNGGPTKTAALLNSPNPSTTLADPAFAVVPPSFNLPVAIDGVSSACSVSDQRGVVPAAGSNCDVGAYLLQATKTALSTSASAVGENISVTYTATVTPAPDGGTVSFNDGAGNPATTHCATQALSGGTATCTVSYPRSGSYPVTATYSGDGATNDFAASASTPGTLVVAPPTLSKLSVSPHAFKAAGRKVRGQCVKATGRSKHAKPCQLSIKLKATYALNTAVKVSFKLALSTTGRKVHGRCVRATRKNKRQPKCALPVGVGKPIARSGVNGSNTFTFTGRLAAGTYQLTATPAGGTPRTVTFRVTG